MVELADTVFIDVSPGRVWQWLAEFPAHYGEWHPDHVSCRYERGDALEVGSVICVREYLHGRLHTLRMRATQIVPGRRIRYVGVGFEGAFLVDAEGGGSRFTAQLGFGTRVPVLGTAVDWVLRRAMRRRLLALRSHMREEGENLKALLESDGTGPLLR